MSGNFSSTSQSPRADIPIPNPKYCLISMAAEQALDACAATRSALQQLRDLLINCHQCSALDSCDLHEHFNMLVDQAIAELNEDWGW